MLTNAELTHNCANSETQRLNTGHQMRGFSFTTLVSFDQLDYVFYLVSFPTCSLGN